MTKKNRFHWGEFSFVSTGAESGKWGAGGSPLRGSSTKELIGIIVVMV
jgi:hypothetical protein